MNRALYLASVITAAVLASTPALAGTIRTTPAPVAGLGIGAVALIGIGYRALKNRANR